MDMFWILMGYFVPLIFMIGVMTACWRSDKVSKSLEIDNISDFSLSLLFSIVPVMNIVLSMISIYVLIENVLPQSVIPEHLKGENNEQQ